MSVQRRTREPGLSSGGRARAQPLQTRATPASRMTDRRSPLGGTIGTRRHAGRQHSAQLDPRGDGDVRRTARGPAVCAARRRGRLAAVLDHARAFPGAGHPPRPGGDPATAPRRRRGTDLSARRQRQLELQGPGRRRQGGVRPSRLAARVLPGRGELLSSLPRLEGEGRAAGRTALPGLDPDRGQRVAAARVPASRRSRQGAAGLHRCGARRGRRDDRADPADELAIQWDCSTELQDVYGGSAGAAVGRRARAQRAADPRAVARHAGERRARVPPVLRHARRLAAVRARQHRQGGRPRQRVHRRRRPPVDWMHIPMLDRVDDAYYAPLRRARAARRADLSRHGPQHGDIPGAAGGSHGRHFRTSASPPIAASAAAGRRSCPPFSTSTSPRWQKCAAATRDDTDGRTIRTYTGNHHEIEPSGRRHRRADRLAACGAGAGVADPSDQADRADRAGGGDRRDGARCSATTSASASARRS